jgi:predicted  nucleic acid-binding Zn-ribbon protein
LCQEDLLKSKEKIFNVEEFLFLQKKQETLETKYKNLKNQASSLLNHIKKGGALDQDETKEIMFKLENEVKELKINKEDLEKELVKLKEEGQGKVKLLGSKKKELEDLKKTIISENDLGEDDLDDILEDQENVSKNPNEKTIKKLERTKKRFLKLITESEINQLCQLQSEITNLEIDLGKIEQRIINVQGNAFLGNITTGDNANFGNINVQNNNSAIQEQNNYDSKQTEIESLMVQEPKSNNPPF